MRKKPKTSISVKLYAGFFIPIFFIILLGITSNKIATKALIENYEKSLKSVIEMSGEYLSFGLDGIESIALQYTLDSDMVKYTDNLMLNVLDQNRYMKRKQSELLAKAIAEKFIKYIVILPKDKGEILFSEGITQESFANEFIDSLEVKDQETMWIKTHPLIDEKLGIKESNYAFSYVKFFPQKEAVVVVDVDNEAIFNILSGMNLGKGSVVGVVGSNGIEVTSQEGFSFADNNLLESNKENQYFSIDGKNYLFLSQKVGDTNLNLCALVPLQIITKQAKEIQGLTLVITVITIIIAGLIGLFISTDISKVLKKSCAQIGKIAKGNLTIRVNSNRTDEFGELAGGINDMVDGVHSLVSTVAMVSKEVVASAKEVNTNVSYMKEDTQGINDILSEIERGSVEQSEDAQNCLVKMGNLSGEIDRVRENTQKMIDNSEKIEQQIKEGITTIEGLTNKSNSTQEKTEQLTRSFFVMKEKSQNIQEIVGMINDIATQTNLLSLNASIEAARAGTFGRGFNVVAEEIRKLSEESSKAADHIKKMIKEVITETNNADVNAQYFKSAIEEQVVYVQQTKNTFDGMNIQTKSINRNVEEIKACLEKMEEEKQITLTAIENMSAVTEETAASTSTVIDNLKNSLQSAERIFLLSGGLIEHVDNLDRSIEKFTLIEEDSYEQPEFSPDPEGAAIGPCPAQVVGSDEDTDL